MKTVKFKSDTISQKQFSIAVRKIAPIVEKNAKEFGIIYNLKPGFFSAFLSHVQRLKALGQQSSSRALSNVLS